MLLRGFDVDAENIEVQEQLLVGNLKALNLV